MGLILYIIEKIFVIKYKNVGTLIAGKWEKIR
jgi:hypothetical protein